MFCKHCGKNLISESRFCPSCGNKLTDQVVKQDSANTEPIWESKTISVQPGSDSYTIEIYECFGWELVSTQDVKTKDSHLENRFGTLYNVTESEAYTKLFFRRNKRRKNYDKLVSLEAEYYANSFDDTDNDNVINKLPYIIKKYIGWICVVLAVISGVSMIPYAFVDSRSLFVLIGPLFWLGLGVILIRRFKKMEPTYEQEREEHENDVGEKMLNRQRILEEAKTYLM